MEVTKSIFRENDIRGTYPEQLNEYTIGEIGKAIAAKCRKENIDAISVGRDGRLSGESLLDAFCDSLVNSGINVTNVGLVTSPMLYFEAKINNSKSGIIITGSHNPKNHNGLKMVIDDKPVSGTEVLALIEGMKSETFRRGTLQFKDIKEEYLRKVTESISILNPEKYKVVIDCGNGAAGCIAPELFKKVGCEVIELFSEVDGNFPNHHPDPSKLENMEDLINQLKTYSQESQIEIKSMQEKENFRRNFIGNLAHELKTPLFTSQSYLLTLIDGALKDENVNLKYLKIAEKAVERLIFIVKDLDLITKLESDNMNLEKSKFNLISIINNVFEMLEIQANKKNISLLIDSKMRRVNVHADQEKIHQVLTNLIENSIKYGKEDGTTEVSIEDLVEDRLIIRITDNGKGIKKEHFERLFERFYRVENSGNRSTGGSGLGLAIVKHIIDAHNEKIYVESDLGVGSEFSFSLEKSN
jgi:two-component system phosphate regulon sensor histidine kinase PhoR